MKKISYLFVLTFLFYFLTGCNKPESPITVSEQTPTYLRVSNKLAELRSDPTVQIYEGGTEGYSFYYEGVYEYTKAYLVIQADGSKIELYEGITDHTPGTAWEYLIAHGGGYVFRTCVVGGNDCERKPDGTLIIKED